MYLTLKLVKIAAREGFIKPSSGYLLYFALYLVVFLRKAYIFMQTKITLARKNLITSTTSKYGS